MTLIAAKARQFAKGLRMQENFSSNLRSLCAEFGSVAQICRAIGINRQQFNRYLNGTSMPSAHNLRRIARYFDLPEARLFAPLDQFDNWISESTRNRSLTSSDNFLEPFRDQHRNLKRYIGFYHSFFRTPSWDGMIFCSLIQFREKDGFIQSRSLENATSTDKSIRQISRYDGLVTMRGNRIFVTEHERARNGSVAQTILFSAHRQQLKYLRGMTMGVAWRPYPRPYAAKAIWKRLDERVTAREAISACGIYPVHSTRIDLTIRKYLDVQASSEVPDTSGSMLF